MSAIGTTYLEYSDVEHRYFADGRELPSVTQILDQAGLISPYCKDEEARFRGTQVHEFCAVDDVNRLDFRKVPAEYRGYIMAWRKYRKDTGFTPELIEQRVDCLEFGYSGRFDRYGLRPLRGGTAFQRVIIDLKTSKTGAVPDYARLQLAAYNFAFLPLMPIERIAVSLRPDGRYNCKIFPITDFLRDKAEWLSLVIKTKEQTNGNSSNGAT